MSRLIVILGAGGHARVLLSALRRTKVEFSGCIAREPADRLWPSSITYLGNDSVLSKLDPADTVLVNGVGSTRSTEIRQRLFELGKSRGFGFLSVQHPNAVIEDGVNCGEGSQIMVGAIIQCGADVGANSIINSGAIIEHDCRIGAHCHVAPGVCLSGSVITGSGVHIGAGATIIQGIVIGDRAMIAAGAVVVSDVAAGACVAGVPANSMAARA